MTSRRKRKQLMPTSLSIDTTRERGTVVLTDPRTGETVTRTLHLRVPGARKGALLRAVERAVRIRAEAGGQHRKRVLDSVVEIAVVPGPGAFSSVRLGVVTANALAWALGVPVLVHGKRVAHAMPEYGGEPNITLPSGSIAAMDTAGTSAKPMLLSLRGHPRPKQSRSIQEEHDVGAH